MRSVVVTGAAGSLGERVVDRLAARPEVGRVVGVDAVAPTARQAKVAGVALDLAGAGAADELAGLLGGSEAVLHLAWQAPPHPGRRAATAVAAANRRATAALLDAVAAAGVPALVALSSATVYGAWPDNQVPLTEEAPLRPNPRFAFAVGRAEAERQVGEWSRAQPATTVAVLRPAVTVGAAEPAPDQAVAGIGAPGSGDGWRPVQFLHIDDLADAVVLAWDRRLAGAYNVAPDGGISEETARALAGGVAKVALPARAAQLVSAWGWALWHRGVPREARAYATYPWVIAPDRLKEAGWAPRYTSEEALVATDLRPHWDDLPPSRRQRVTLAAAGAAAGLGVAAAVAGGRALRSHRRR